MKDKQLKNREMVKLVPVGWFNLPGDHPICVYLRDAKLVKGYRHYGINRWSMILNAEGQVLRKALVS